MTHRKAKNLSVVPPVGLPDIPGDCPPRTLDEVHAVYRRWFGAGYDLQVLDCVLCVAASERLDGDPGRWVREGVA